MIVAVEGADEAELVRHLTAALGRHVAWCRTNAVPVPAAVSTLLDLCVSRSGPGWPTLAPTPPAIEPVAVGVNEAAKCLGVSPTTIRRQAASGELPSILVRRRRLVLVAALRAVTTERSA